VLCGLRTPEDLLRVPGSDWVIASSLRGVGVHAVHVRDYRTLMLYPGPGAHARPDQRRYPGCPGPQSDNELAKFDTHGLALRRESATRFTLYAVHHGNRESIEVFALDMAGTLPAATWVGCIVAPEGVNLNSLVAVPGGGLIASNFLPPGKDPQAARTRVMAGEINGELWEWQAARGWAKVPGSEASGANGVEISPDGKWIYFNAWGNKSFVRLSRGPRPPRRTDVPLGFRLDNIHWAPDGTILGGGQTDPDVASRVIKIDPRTLEVKQLLEKPDTKAFLHSTGAIQVADEIWLATSRTDAIAIFPLTAH
jgi:hypothetical protein